MARGLVGVLCVCGVVVAAQASVPRATNITAGCVERVDPAADYFPDKVAIEDASTFSVEYRKSYKVVTIKEVYAGGPGERYVLVQCGTPVPRLEGELAGAQVVTVPLASPFATGGGIRRWCVVRARLRIRVACLHR